MIGKSICKYLKSVRRAVAEANGIDLEIPECTFEGECSGTCPRCEAEVQMLEKALSARKRMAQKVAVVGVAAGLSFLGPPIVSAQNVTPTDTICTYPSVDTIPWLDAISPKEDVHYITLGDCEPIIKWRPDVTNLTDNHRYLPLLKSTVEVDDIIIPASFPGGQAALDEYIAKNVIYPANGSISGVVVVEFLVNTDGSITKVKTIRGVDPLLDTEAERLVASMPRWEPTIVNGRKTAFYYELPIQFYLK